MNSLSLVLSAVIAVATIVAVVTQPFRIPDWVFALMGASAALIIRLDSPIQAWVAVRGGLDVYAFLAGIMMLAALAQHEQVFGAVADWALRTARGSSRLLFVLLFAICVVVTAMLSNDTTAVILAPVFVAVLDRSSLSAAPYLYTCAFVANAASYVFPFSNPANLLMLAGRMPGLTSWIQAFGLSSAGAILVTFCLLLLVFRRDLRARYSIGQRSITLSRGALAASIGITGTFGMLIWAAMTGNSLGAVALLGGILTCGATLLVNHRAVAALAAVHWGVLPLVGGLLVIVDALDHSGALRFFAVQIAALHAHHGPLTPLAVLGIVSVAGNALNNLPVALSVAHAFSAEPTSSRLFHAAIVGVDLGPNLLTTGSLSTLLWMRIVRSAGHTVSFRAFARVGILVGIPALIVAGLLIQ